MRVTEPPIAPLADAAPVGLPLGISRLPAGASATRPSTRSRPKIKGRLLQAEVGAGLLLLVGIRTPPTILAAPRRRVDITGSPCLSLIAVRHVVSSGHQRDVAVIESYCRV